jgi:hypothetical protein
VTQDPTISGIVETISYREVGPPPTEEGERSVVESVSGTFMLVADHKDGSRMVLEDATFDLSVEGHRYRWQP